MRLHPPASFSTLVVLIVIDRSNSGSRNGFCFIPLLNKNWGSMLVVEEVFEMSKIYRLFILLFAIWFGFAGQFPASTVRAADLPFDQGEGYEPGAYDRDAALPTAFNWTRQSRYAGSSDHDLKWSFEAEDAIYSTPVIGADGMLYIGSYDGKLYALNASSGKLKWVFETGFAIASSPAIGADGTIYIGSGDGKLYALDPYAADDGDRLKWSFATGDRIYSSPSIGADGTIYVSSYDGWLYALDPDAADGEKEKWSYEIGAGRNDSSPAIGADGMVYVGSADGIFYALDPNAADDDDRLKWSVELNMEWDGLCWDEPCPIYSSPAIGADGTIYVGSNDGYVYALDALADDDEERMKWSYETWGSVLSSPAIGADGTVYVGSSDGALYALDPNAEYDHDREKWSFGIGWNVIISSPVMDADGMIYFGSIDWYGNGTLYALDANAEDDAERVKWSFTTEGEIRSSPVIGPDGTIYIGSFDHKLYAIGTKTIAPPERIAAATGDNSVKLSWDVVDEAIGYKVYMYKGAVAPAPPDEWILVNDELIAEAEYTATNLTAGQLYWFTVTAVGAEGMESGFSEYVSSTPYANVMRVEPFAPIQVAKGVEPDELLFPTKAHVQLTDGTELDLPVTWDLLNSDYNPGQAGAYTFIGELQLTAHIHNPQNLNAELTVGVLPSTSAKLVSIQLNGEPLQGFKSEIYTYTVRFPYATEQVTVTAATYEPEADYEIIGGNPQRLQVGDNLIEIVVTAENGDQQQYTITVIREQDAEAPVWPSGSELYVSNVAQTSIRLSWPAASDNVAVAGYRLYINGSKKVDEAVGSFEYSTADSSYSYTMTGLIPATNYHFTVKAYDAAGNESEPGLSNTAKTLSRSSGGWYVSSNANLKTLEVWADGKQVPLEPTFAKDTLSYSVKTEVNQVELKASAEHSAAKVTWQGRELDDSLKIDLMEGENTISLIVQAEDGSRKTYTLVIERIVPDSEEAERPEQPTQPEQPVISFTDIAGHWAESYIQHAAAQGIVNGYPDGTFKPDHSVTRAEFTVMLAGALNLEGKGAALTFTDHDQIGVWANQAIAQSVQAGIINGYGDGSFRPDAPITRAEMAVMIARALNLLLEGNVTTGFADDADIPTWAKGAAEAIRKLSVIQGRGANRFVPNATATRAEAAVMLLRMLEVKESR